VPFSLTGTKIIAVQEGLINGSTFRMKEEAFHVCIFLSGNGAENQSASLRLAWGSQCFIFQLDLICAD
jgi:hypothetical protein